MLRRRFIRQITAGSSLLTLGIPQKILAVSNSQIKGIHIFSKHLQFLDYDRMAQKAKEIGFDGLDLTVRPGGHIEPENVERDLPKAAEAIQKQGLQLKMMTTRITDPHDPLTEKILKTASKLGVTDYRMGYLSYDPKLPVDESLRRMQGPLKELAAMNKQYGIRGAYQNHSGLRVGGPVWDLFMLLNEIDPEWLGIQYDIRHATAEGGTAWPTGYHLVKKLIHSLDIKDFMWARVEDKWKLQNVPLGEGMVEFDRFFEMLKADGIGAPISIHYEYPLGGADHGHKELTMPVSEITESMKLDLTYLKKKLTKAGLLE